MEQTVSIPLKTPSLNEYTDACRKNPYVGANMKKSMQKAYTYYFLRLKPVERPVTIDFEWTEKNRKRDLDNVAFGKKFLLDALVAAGVLPDDSPRWVVGFRDTFKQGEDYKITITIKEIEDGQKTHNDGNNT